MANSINDVSALTTQWTDLYSTTSIPTGTALIIQNKGTSPVLIQIASSLPISSDRKGTLLMPLLSVAVSSGEAGCYALALDNTAALNVQRGS